MIIGFSFILLHITAILAVALLYIILKMNNKTQLHYSFSLAVLLLFIWTFGHLLEVYSMMYDSSITMVFVNFYYFGLIFIPVPILFTGIIYLKTKIKLSPKLLIFLIFPIIDYVMLLTNDFHHLYFKSYSIFNNTVKYGDFFIIHTIVSYLYIFVGIGLLAYSSIKNSGFFSKQSALIIVGVSLPLLINILATLKIFVMPAYSTAIAFSLAVLFFALSIFRYQFLSVAPIALRTVVDRISDSFIVVNEDNQIIDYNQPIETVFQNFAVIQMNSEVSKVFEGTCLMEGEYNLIELIDMAKASATPVVFEKHVEKEDFDRHFSIEITPINSNKNHIGTIILFRDITENVKNLEAIEEKHTILMEQERLASLGQLIGGIAHNLKTPIMSISGAVEGLKDLVAEYEHSIGDASVSEEEHREIAGEMRTWLNKIQPYCSYMSDIIDTVKGQTMNFTTTMMTRFTIPELLKRIDLLLKYELIKLNCTLNTVIKVNPSTELYGDINSLVQVFDNIIINAIQAYEGKDGVIDFIIEENTDNILFTVRDYGKGIPEKVKEKLLKEMVTTKGTAGTGLGLYMSNSTIKARFEGKMWFESGEGEGTTIYIRIPLRN